MHALRRAVLVLCPATAVFAPVVVCAATPVVVQNEAGFEGLEEPTVLYFPASNTFQTGDTFKNHVDEGGGMFRDTLRNEYPTPLPPYASGPGWWDGDGADSANTDRQRSEPKGIVGLGHQQVEQTFEYSFDFRTDPTFTATSNFCHIFQLKATNGDDSPPLATISLYKNGSGIQGRVDCFTDGTTGTNNEIIPTTFNYTAGQWIHFDIRITPCAEGETTGAIQLSVNGGPFTGITNAAIDLAGSTDFRPKFGFYRGISTTNGVPAGDSWVEHRTITGYNGTSNVLAWSGGQNNNTWDTATTANFLNGSTASVFNTIDQVNFTGSTNTTINVAGNVWPDFADVNSSANFTFQGTGSITGGTLRKDGTGTLTLATSNSYPGLTDVRAGTLFVTGSIGSNSLASITGGTLKVGSATALGSGTVNGTQINGGTLDINGFSIGTEPVSVQGTGVSGAGAIVNNGAQQTNAMTGVTLIGDTTLGGTGRWDIRGTGAALSTGGSAYNLTKTGSNQISFVGATIDSALANITVSQGVLAFQTSTTSMGDPTKTLTIASGAVLDFFNTTGVMNKVCALNGGTIWAESGTGSQNTFSGNVTLGSGGGIVDAGGPLTGGTANSSAALTLSGAIGGAGGLTKNGPGAVFITSAGNNWSGSTSINAGTLTLATGAAMTSPGITVVSGATFNVNGAIATNATVNANGVTNFGGSTTSAPLGRPLSTLNIGGGGITTVTASAFPFTPAILQPSVLSFANSTSRLNLTNNELVTNGTAAGAKAQINSGQIFTTATGGALGYADLVGGKVEVRFTVPGDTNLDGTVDVTDLGNLASNFGLTTGALWSQGDFDFNNTVDVADLGDLASNFGSSLAGGSGASNGTSAAAFAAGVTSVPEPTGLLAIAFIAPMLGRRRRQRI